MYKLLFWMQAPARFRSAAFFLLDFVLCSIIELPLICCSISVVRTYLSSCFVVLFLRLLVTWLPCLSCLLQQVRVSSVILELLFVALFSSIRNSKIKGQRDKRNTTLYNNAAVCIYRRILPTFLHQFNIFLRDSIRLANILFMMMFEFTYM